MTLPSDDKERKGIPVYAGFVRYFPDAIVAVAKHSADSNEQHNPGEPLHWNREKSKDELESLMRHIVDEDWVAVAWRAMANLQKHIEASRAREEGDDAAEVYARAVVHGWRLNKKAEQDYIDGLNTAWMGSVPARWKLLGVRK